MPEDVAAQAQQSLKNVQATTEASGLTMNSVFKMTVFVKDLNTFATVNEVDQTFFDAPVTLPIPAQRLHVWQKMPWQELKPLLKDRK